MIQLPYLTDISKIGFRRLWVAMAICITILPFLTGCPSVPVNNYVNDPTDPCSNERMGLEAHNNYFAQDIAKGTTAGAGVGALAILFADDAWLWGPMVAAGAAAGAATGYYSAIQSREGQSPSGFFGTIIKSAEEEQQRVIAMTNSIERLLICRQDEEAQIRIAYNNKQIDRFTAEQRLAKLRQRVDEDMIVANSIRKGMGTHMEGLQFAALKSAPGQISYVSMDAPEQAQPQAVLIPQVVPIPQKVQDDLAKAPDAPVPDTAEAQAKQQKMVQSVSQLQDVYKKANSSISNLGQVATRPLDEGIDGPSSLHSPLFKLQQNAMFLAAQMGTNHIIANPLGG